MEPEEEQQFIVVRDDGVVELADITPSLRTT